ncbi:MAG: hydroxymethylbilane synthase [Gammaproteobacteria bacterium]
MNASPPIRIATRGSRLALWQAEHVRARLRDLHPGLPIELVVMKTAGDRILDTPLAKIGGKGLFIKELEQAMLAGAADLAVHSMKDVPVELPDALHIPTVLAREDPRDCLVARDGATLATLRPDAVVGTSSLRRRSQLLALRGDLELRDLRGNVTTRLEKLQRGEFDGIVLAAAGLRRLGLADHVTEYFASPRLLPAVGQGIIGIECRRGDAWIESLIAPLLDTEAWDALAAERALNETLQGGCQVPIAGHARLDGETLELEALVASLDGREQVRGMRRGARAAGAALGRELAHHLLERGAARILREIGAEC